MLWVGLAGGLWAGITSALGAKRMHETSGVAMLHDEGSWLATRVSSRDILPGVTPARLCRTIVLPGTGATHAAEENR